MVYCVVAEYLKICAPVTPVLHDAGAARDRGCTDAGRFASATG
jgi:hypothetical protein